MAQQRRPIRALFVTYAMLAAPGVGPSMIGALKRSVRLLRHLPPDEVEPLWVHSGPVFRQDPLIGETLPMLPRYSLSGRPVRSWRATARERFWRGADRLSAVPAWNLPRVILAQGLPQLYQAAALRRLMARLTPDVVVLADNPLSGLLRRASQVARELGVPQVGIDDYLGRRQEEALVRSSPQVDQWLLVGIPFDGRMGRLSPRLVVSPPLQPGGGETAAPVDVTIFGYDPGIARLGADLLARLPAGTTACMISTALTGAQREELRRRAGPAALNFVPFPTETGFQALLRASGVVFCKSGFQQIVESLAVGTPVVACDVPGGVPEVFMDEELRRFVRYLPARPEEWEATLAEARQWLAARPPVPWAADLARLDSPARYGAGLFADLLRHAVERRGPAIPRHQEPAGGERRWSRAS